MCRHCLQINNSYSTHCHHANGKSKRPMQGSFITFSKYRGSSFERSHPKKKHSYQRLFLKQTQALEFSLQRSFRVSDLLSGNSWFPEGFEGGERCSSRGHRLPQRSQKTVVYLQQVCSPNSRDASTNFQISQRFGSLTVLFLLPALQANLILSKFSLTFHEVSLFSFMLSEILYRLPLFHFTPYLIFYSLPH